jgi:sec-independent protein translocase protein TatC
MIDAPVKQPMGFLDHLEELRKRIIYALVALTAGAIAGIIFSQRLIDLLTRPLHTDLVFLSPSEALVTQLKVALIAGALVASPVIFYQFWRFVRPALRPGEAKYITWAVLFSTLFFIGGMAFAYFIMVPFGMKFLLSFETEKLHAMLSIKNYVGTVTGFMFAAGLIFQMPIVIFFVTKLGIIKPRVLVKNQRIAIVIIFIVAAILSPPDVFSQIMMAIPLLVLYYLSIIGSYIAVGRNRPAPPVPDAADQRPNGDT